MPTEQAPRVWWDGDDIRVENWSMQLRRDRRPPSLLDSQRELLQLLATWAPIADRPGETCEFTLSVSVPRHALSRPGAPLTPSEDMIDWSPLAPGAFAELRTTGDSPFCPELPPHAGVNVRLHIFEGKGGQLSGRLAVQSRQRWVLALSESCTSSQLEASYELPVFISHDFDVDDVLEI